jgi:peptidyl-dipeptidase Dcp
MRKNKLTVLMTALSIVTTALASNPFFESYNTPYQTIPFNLIKTEHYLPAFEEAMKQHDKEIATIINNKKAPTFENTIEALERSGSLLNKVGSPFYNLLGSETNDDLQAIAETISPLMSEHSNAIRLNEKLFARVKAVNDQKDKLKLNAEQKMLLKETYDGFANNGANLSDTDKAIYKELSKELSMLSLQYGQNILKETNKYNLLITNKNLLNGLPTDVLEMLASTAKKAGKDGWMLNLKATTYGPILNYIWQMLQNVFWAENMIISKM